MKSLLQFLTESSSVINKLGNLKYELSKDDVAIEIQDYFVSLDEWDEKQNKQLQKLLSKVSDDIKFAEVEDEDLSFDINDEILKNPKSKKIATIDCGENDPTVELYKFDNRFIIQTIGDDDMYIFISK